MTDEERVKRLGEIANERNEILSYWIAHVLPHIPTDVLQAEVFNRERARSMQNMATSRRMPTEVLGQ